MSHVTPREKDEFEAALRVYVAKARRTTESKTTRRKASGSGWSKEENQAARQWLKLRDEEVSERGRIKKELMEKWEQAGKPGL